MAWTNPPTEYSKTVIKVHTDLMREASLRVLRGVVLKSPVDTGRFRANWQVSEGTVIKSEVTNYNAGENESTKGAVTTQALRSGTQKVKDLKPFSTVYVINNLPYASRLENGWSDQAPKGMVSLTLLEVKTWLDNLK